MSLNPLGTLVGNGRPKSQCIGRSLRKEMTDNERTSNGSKNHEQGYRH